jgi:hypothetical protein
MAAMWSPNRETCDGSRFTAATAGQYPVPDNDDPAANASSAAARAASIWESSTPLI